MLAKPTRFSCFTLHQFFQCKISFVVLIAPQVHCQIAGPDSSFAAKCLLNLGQLQLKVNQIDSAEANVREALSMYEQMFPESNSIEIARSRHFLALVLKDKRSYEDAVHMLRSSRSIYRTLSKWIHVAISCREQRFVDGFVANYSKFTFVA